MGSNGPIREVFCGPHLRAAQKTGWRIVAPSPILRLKIGSGAWTRTKITSSKGWRATNCTTPETRKHFTSLSQGVGRKVRCVRGVV